MHLPLSALLFFLTALSPPPFFYSLVQGSHWCPRDCACYEHADLVDCRGRGFQRVPRGIPPGTWLLELGENDLREVDARAFAGLWSLRVLVMKNSHIQVLQPQVKKQT